jgi:LMBR1 domain-containing protein 1
MVDFVTLGCVILVTMISLVVGLNYLITKHYTEPGESYTLATVVTVLSLSVTLLATLLVPLDLFITAGVKLVDFDFTQEELRGVLFGCFIAMLLLAFLFIPFTYFYGEERFDEIDSDSFCDRVCESLKYTAAFVIVCLVLVIVGLILRPEKEDWGEGKEWVQKLFDVEHVGEAAISFTVACLTIFGVFAWSVYTAYGLAAMPWTLIKGNKSLEAARSELDLDLSKIREKHREILMRSSRSNTRPTRREMSELAKLKRQEKQLTARTEKLEEMQRDTSQLLSGLLKCLTPFRVLLGVTGLLLSTLIFAGMVLGAIDRVLNSECGLACGFMASSTSVFNPVDWILVRFAPMFPLDFMAFSVIVIYIYLASIYAVVSVGIKLACYTIFRFKKKRTMPQALLIASIILMLVFLGLSLELLTLAPHYTTFGAQIGKTTEGTTPCSLAELNDCTMSVTSSFFNK